MFHLAMRRHRQVGAATEQPEDLGGDPAMILKCKGLCRQGLRTC